MLPKSGCGAPKRAGFTCIGLSPAGVQGRNPLRRANSSAPATTTVITPARTTRLKASFFRTVNGAGPASPGSEGEEQEGIDEPDYHRDPPRPATLESGVARQPRRRRSWLAWSLA